MFFKNAIFYRITKGIDEIVATLNVALENNKFSPLGRHDMERSGFVPPVPRGEEMAHIVDGKAMVCMHTEERIIPGPALRKLVNKKVEEIEAKEDCKVYNREKQSIKEDILHDITPQALIKESRIYAYFDVSRELLIVDAGSASKAEKLCKLLREALGSLPAIPMQVMASPAVVMTEHLKTAQFPELFVVQQSCELREPGEGGAKHTCKDQDLLGEEVEVHLNAGKQVVKLALEWDEQVKFTLLEDLSLKQVKFADKLVCEAEESSGGDKAAQFDADFVLMSRAVGGLVAGLQAMFGGAKADPDLAPAAPVNDGFEAPDSGANDSLFGEAKEFVINSGRASISAVQRELRIGYNRSARLIEALEAAGVVSPIGESGGREVLVSPADVA